MTMAAMTTPPVDETVVTRATNIPVCISISIVVVAAIAVFVVVVIVGRFPGVVIFVVVVIVGWVDIVAFIFVVIFGVFDDVGTFSAFSTVHFQREKRDFRVSFSRFSSSSSSSFFK